MKIKSLIRLILAGLLIYCLAPNPYSYYQAIRVAATLAFWWLATLEFEKQNKKLGTLLIAAIVLFNPVFPIHMSRFIWNIFDLAIAALLIFWVIVDLVILNVKQKSSTKNLDILEKDDIKSLMGKRKIKILHLDDHSIYSKGVENCLKPYLGEYTYLHFENSFTALTFIKEAFNKGERIDLIITDLKHPGLDGCEFAKNVRFLGKDKNINTPILLLTMFKQFPEIEESLNNGIINKHLLKSAQASEILEFINSAIQNNYNNRS